MADSSNSGSTLPELRNPGGLDRLTDAQMREELVRLAKSPIGHYLRLCPAYFKFLGGKDQLIPALGGWTDESLLTNDPDSVADLWYRYSGAAAVTRCDHLFVIDIDRLPGPDGARSVNNPWPATLPEEARQALDTGLWSRSPSGGNHIYFRRPESADSLGIKAKIAWVDGVDLLTGAGKIVVMPPSFVDRVEKGYCGRYQWVDSACPLDLPMLPEVLQQLFAATPARAEHHSMRARHSEPQVDISEIVPPAPLILEGSRNDVLFRRAARWRSDGHGEAEILVLLKHHNSTYCRPPLELAELDSIARSASRYDPNEPNEPVAEHRDPGPLPDRLLTVPGLVARVMDLMLTTAPRPNRPLAFAGALALLALLAGRKVSTESDLRTNIYLIALGASGIGKDHQRKVIKMILFELGLGNCLIGSLASGQALEDEVRKNPSCLALTDELDELMMAIRLDKSGTRQNLAKVLMELFTSASVPYQTRAKAGQERYHVDQPNLCLFGTAVPERFYESVSARMLDDGFLGRSLIIEAGALGPRQRAGKIVIPKDILEEARFWVEIDSESFWDKEHPTPRVVSPDQDAAEVLEQAANQFDDVQRRAQAAGDVSAVSIWARAWEHASKLALLYAISENPNASVISRDAAIWAVEFAGHHSRRLIATTHGCIAENAFHALLIKAKAKLRSSPERTMGHSKFMRNMHLPAPEIGKIIEVLRESGEIEVLGGGHGETSQRGTSYRLVSE